MSRRAGQPVDRARRHSPPIYGAGFVTAYGAHAVAANLGSYAPQGPRWQLGLWSRTG
jgi:hypothetical protein